MIFWSASVINWLWENGFDWNRVKKGVLIFCSIFMVLLAFGGIRTSPRFYSYDEETAKIAAVNYDSHSPEDVFDMFKYREFTDLDTALPITYSQMLRSLEYGFSFIRPCSRGGQNDSVHNDRRSIRLDLLCRFAGADNFQCFWKAESRSCYTLIH